jgi:hypothetical protein
MALSRGTVIPIRIESSGEISPRALPESYVNFLIHTAPGHDSPDWQYADRKGALINSPAADILPDFDHA